jgi:hypothetical protein
VRAVYRRFRAGAMFSNLSNCGTRKCGAIATALRPQSKTLERESIAAGLFCFF